MKKPIYKRVHLRLSVSWSCGGHRDARKRYGYPLHPGNARSRKNWYDWV